jgi:hypothetical protein
MLIRSALPMQHDRCDFAAAIIVTQRRKGPMRGHQRSGAAAYYHGLILYYGGECRDAKARIASDEFGACDPKTDSWKALAKAPSALHAQAAAVVGDTAYFIGFHRRLIELRER